MEEAKISIIMPVYNAGEYIKEAIESVQKQSISELEIICINDGSEDDSLQIIEEYKKDDHRIICVTTENQGAGKARNLGISLAKGEYIFFLDPDDYLYSDDVLEKLYNLAEENHVLISGGNCCIDKEGELVVEGEARIYNFEQDGMVEYKDYQADYYYWRFLYNRIMLVKNQIYFPDYRRYQDPPFMVKTMSLCGKLMATKDMVYCYRKTGKPMVWTEEKCLGTIRGVRDEVFLAKENQYDKLYLRLFRRMFSGWAHDALYQAATVYNSEEADECIRQIKNCINLNMLKRNGVKLDNSIWKLENYYEGSGYSQSFLRALRSPKGVILYGAGIVGERMAQQFKLKYWNNIIGFAVSDNKEGKKEVQGVPVFLIDELLEYRETANVFISTSPVLHTEIEEKLIEMGFKNIYLIDWAELKKSAWF